MDLSVFFAGTAGAVPSARRGLPALLVRRGGERLLFDCGEGTQRQLARSVGLADLDDVFLTHFHADHWLGLPGLIKTLDLRARERPLNVHGPPGLRDLLTGILRLTGRPSYGLRVRELGPGDTVQRDGYRISAVPVAHRGAAAYGYALIEDERPGRFDPVLAERLGVRPGPDFGRLLAGETVAGVHAEQVVGPPRRGRRVVVSGDTRPCASLRAAADDVDLLICEATFLDEERERAAQTGHSTARQAAALARDAGVRLLALTHLSPRYTGREVRDEARAVLPSTEVPRDFDQVELPLPERGEPCLVRWEQVTQERSAPSPADRGATSDSQAGEERPAGAAEAARAGTA